MCFLIHEVRALKTVQFSHSDGDGMPNLVYFILIGRFVLNGSFHLSTCLILSSKISKEIICSCFRRILCGYFVTALRNWYEDVIIERNCYQHVYMYSLQDTYMLCKASSYVLLILACTAYFIYNIFVLAFVDRA